MNDREAGRLCVHLTKAGFLKRQRQRATTAWLLTEEGIRLRCATAARPLHRKTADQLLAGLIERINLLNASPLFLAYVQRATVFGSYLGTSARISDLDVAIELIPRISNRDEFMTENLRHAAEAEVSGRRFSNFVDKSFWWQNEALLFLRNRKRGLSLQPGQDGRQVAERGAHRAVFEWK